MASQVFYRKWRPQTLAELTGQEQVTQTLRNALAGGQVTHAYLFCGPRGTGKTSTGRILAKAVNCLTNNGKGEPCNTCSMCQAITEGRALDVIEVDAASNRRIDEIRELRERVNYAPGQARFKVYIIDEVHMLTNEAANALLKTLEEPPPHAIFVLATTEIHKVLPTILSRCQRFDFHRISQADVVGKLSQICQMEKIEIEPEGLRLVARAAGGSLRDAENILQQLTTYYGAKVELKQVQAILGISGDMRARELVKHVINNDIAAGVATINGVNSDGLDLRQFNRELVACLRALLLAKTGVTEGIDLPTEEIAELKKLAARATLPQVLKAVKIFGQLDLGLDSYSTLPLELALVDCALSAENKKPNVQPEPEHIAPRPVQSHATVAPSPQPKPSATPEPVKIQAAEHKPVAAEPAKAPVAAAKPVTTAVKAAPPVAEHKPAPVPPDKVTPPPAGNPLEQLKQNWRLIIKEAPAGIGRTPAAALLRSALPKDIEGDTVILSFKYHLHKDNMEKPGNQLIAEKIISNFLKRTCRVRCVCEPEDNHLVDEALKIGAKMIPDAEEK